MTSIEKPYNFFSKDEKPAVCNNSWCVMFAILTVVLSIIFACIEIEIEGPCGWADKLPTPATGGNPKTLTIYHCCIFLLMFFVFCSVFFINPQSFNLPNLLFILAFTLIFFTLEDFFWFCLSPFYDYDGTKRDGKGKKAWWHYKIGPIPTLYFALPLISLGLCMFAGYTMTFLRSCAIFICAIIVVALLSPLYQKFYLAKHPGINVNMKCAKQS